jgi:quercetin dioxygenase-like cupin family protein
MTIDNAGWTFADESAIEWQPLGPDVAMKTLGIANGKMMAMFKFDAGYVGGVHEHTNEPEFSYIIEGSMVNNGVEMEAGHSYAAEMGTTHSEFRTDNGATLISVFPVPAGVGD